MASGVATATIDSDGFSPQDGSNAGYRVFGVVTMSTSYATGGDTISAASFGIGRITKMDMAGSDVITAGTNSVILSPVYTSGAVVKIQAFWTGASTSAVMAEVAANTDLSGYTCNVVVYGT